jgi:hypothetical protein
MDFIQSVLDGLFTLALFIGVVYFVYTSLFSLN